MEHRTCPSVIYRMFFKREQNLNLMKFRLVYKKICNISKIGLQKSRIYMLEQVLTNNSWPWLKNRESQPKLICEQITALSTCRNSIWYLQFKPQERILVQKTPWHWLAGKRGHTDKVIIFFNVSTSKNDQWLLNFLRGCKFNLQKTKKKLDLFYTMKTLVPEFFSNRDPFLPEIQELLNRSITLVLPKSAEPSGPRIVITRVRALDCDKTPFLTLIKIGLMHTDILVNEDDNFVIAGVHLLFDLHDLPYAYATQITPSTVKKGITCLCRAYPTRPRGFHFINAPPIFGTVYNIIKRLIDANLSKRIHFYTEKNMDDLYKNIPLSVLPEEYGGEGGPIDKIRAEWKWKFESYRDWFLKDAAYCSDETKRIGKSRTSADMFGVEGSFRKLDID